MDFEGTYTLVVRFGKHSINNEVKGRIMKIMLRIRLVARMAVIAIFWAAGGVCIAACCRLCMGTELCPETDIRKAVTEVFMWTLLSGIIVIPAWGFLAEWIEGNAQVAKESSTGRSEK